MSRGQHHTPEARRKIGAARRGVPRSAETRARIKAGIERRERQRRESEQCLREYEAVGSRDD